MGKGQDSCILFCLHSFLYLLILPMQYFNIRLFPVLVVLLSVFMFSACARRAVFEKSVVVPAASGKVKVKKDDNNNYSIKIQVRDLTTPGNLVPAKTAYLVWNEADNGVFSMGQLVSSRSFLARGFKASLTAISPNKPGRIFITAEDNTNTLAPGPQTVLTTPVF